MVMGKRTAAARMRLRSSELWLIEHGWWACDEGWRHPKLYYAWPVNHALQLQGEVAEGCQDLACRMVRGEA